MPGPAQQRRAREIPDDGALVTRNAYDLRTYVLALYGDFDLAGAPEVERLLERAVASGAEEIVVDLSGLHFIDSSGIRVVLHAHARATATCPGAIPDLAEATRADVCHRDENSAPQGRCTARPVVRRRRSGTARRVVRDLAIPGSWAPKGERDRLRVRSRREPGRDPPELFSTMAQTKTVRRAFG